MALKVSDLPRLIEPLATPASVGTILREFRSMGNVYIITLKSKERANRVLVYHLVLEKTVVI
jgi:hypothetical protein